MSDLQTHEGPGSAPHTAETRFENVQGDDSRFPPVRITRIVSGETLTKTYGLKDGCIEKHGTPNFSKGTALLWDTTLDGVTDGELDYRTVNVYGQPVFEPRPDGRWDVVTSAEYARKPKAGSVPRTKDEGFKFLDGPGVVLLDSDPRPDAFPPIPALGAHELVSIIERVMPEARGAAFHAVPSASAGICLDSTGELVHDKGGVHLYLAALDATDIPRFGAVLFKRLWLAGHGHVALSASGAFLVRTVIDGSVFESNRVDYISPAKLGAGLIRNAHEPINRPGGYLDTRRLPDLTTEEAEQYDALVHRQKDAIKPHAETARRGYIERKVNELIQSGTPPDVAERTIQRAMGETAQHLHGDFPLVFADPRLGAVCVRAVLADPGKFDGKALADPLEGPAYGASTAKFYANTGKGSPLVHSFAHGANLTYQLHSEEATDELTPDEDHQGIDTPNDDRQKAVLSARRSALHNEPPTTIARRIAKQWPSLKDEAETIVKAAMQWRDKLSPGKQIKQHGITKRITTLERLNERFGQLEVRGRAACAVHIPDRLFITLQDLRARVADEIVLTGVSSKGEPQFAAAFDAWHGDCRKRKFREIVFTGKPVKPDQFNLFSEFGVTPSDEGENGCRLILQHILEVICAGDAVAYEAFLSLVGWQIQHIGKPSRIITVMYSEQQQSGKGLILEQVLLPIFGPHGFMTHDEESGLGRFNDSLRGCAYLLMDEAAFARDKRLADKIKGYAAAHTLAIEGKGLPVAQIPSGLNLYMATNHREIAHVEQADARFWILSIAEHRYGDHAYFADVLQEIDNGGLSAFLGLLLARDISGFIPQRDVPRDNAALVQAKAASRNPVDVTCWLEECLEIGRFVGMPPREPEPNDPPAWVPGEYFKSGELLCAYRRWAQSTTAMYKQESSLSVFGSVLTSVGFAPHKRGAGSERYRWIPDQDAARDALNGLVRGGIRVHGHSGR